MSTKPSKDLLTALSELHNFISTIPSWKNTGVERQKKEELFSLTVKAYRKVKAEGYREEKYLGPSLINWINTWSRPYQKAPHDIPLSLFSDNDFSQTPPLLQKYDTTIAKPTASSSKGRKPSPSPVVKSKDAPRNAKGKRKARVGEDGDDDDDDDDKDTRSEGDEDEDDDEEEDEDSDDDQPKKRQQQSSRKVAQKKSVVVKKEKSSPPTKTPPNPKAPKQAKPIPKKPTEPVAEPQSKRRKTEKDQVNEGGQDSDSTEEGQGAANKPETTWATYTNERPIPRPRLGEIPTGDTEHDLAQLIKSHTNSSATLNEVLGHTHALIEAFKNERSEYLQENRDLKDRLRKLEGSFQEHRVELKTMLSSFKDDLLRVAPKVTPNNPPTTDSNPTTTKANASPAAPVAPAPNQATPSVSAVSFNEWDFHCAQVSQGSYPPIPESSVAHGYINHLTPMQLDSIINYPDGDSVPSTHSLSRS